MNDYEELREKLLKTATINGIDELRFISAEDFLPLEVYAKRQPKVIMPTARSIILCGGYIGGDSLPEWDAFGYVRTSRLTYSGFYCDVVEPLRPLQKILDAEGFACQINDGFAEDDAIPLKPAALRVGLGWIGKNTLLINDKYGSFLALGAMLTDAPIDLIYKQQGDRCGTCHNCVDACPMRALQEPHRLYREKCLSDLLESENLTEADAILTEGSIVECDQCQNCCPWNKKHLKHSIETTRNIQCERQKADKAKLFSQEYLWNINECEYAEIVLLNLSGLDLPFLRFRRNLAYAILYGPQGAKAEIKNRQQTISVIYKDEITEILNSTINHEYTIISA